MLKRQLFCEVCGRIVEHLVDGGDEDGGEMALCCLCGRLSSVLPESKGTTVPSSQPESMLPPRPPPLDSRSR
ncbi:MAG: hypothetical protein NVV74_15635 [Magnetospirillum sp.]|nr:hypothetical protein [Magnetospirillum sp.]